ncbi:hypothetical protein VN97_g4400 [Penicillium thymicola]|uniref:(S)-ureidoglycine aminohydrolase cupin domain-containing protein n=1 Tax=Penicillium thymicola TaxID=293382 RepID=A0AAI9XA67_PENTH|nr:hypothetical protein VN97_g4400 [Penicillium thymicola]
MPFLVKPESEIYQVPKFQEIPNVFISDSIGTVEGKTANPLTGAWFRMEQGPSVTSPTYEYNEIGIMVKGEMNFMDEAGQKAKVKAGQVFFFPAGSTITFSSANFGIAWKCRTTHMGKL